MKYVVLLCDGMSDFAVPELNGKTPMMAACKPNMDKLAKSGRVGMVKTVADGMPPGSDVANLSVMGYDPEIYYSGRSPLEAVSMGVELLEKDVAIRCNLVTLSKENDYRCKTMLDYCAGDISTQEAGQLIDYLKLHLASDCFSFYHGTSYRHCLVWKNGPVSYELTPPHDITLKPVKDYLPDGQALPLLELMEKSYDLLKDHPVNQRRVKEGKNPANSIWLWGQGRKPKLTPFKEKFGLNGSVISAVNLLKGIGICAGMTVCEVKGATGYLDTNFEGKTNAALHELEQGQDLVYLHFEAPDECGHRHEVKGKVKAIEYIDKRVLSPLLEGLEKYEDYKIMILPDHSTPLVTRTHSNEPVPFLIYQKSLALDSGVKNFNEITAKSTGYYVPVGHTLINEFLNMEK